MFIDAAKMTDNCWLKTGLYACSVLPAWSRINDDAHFPSQAFLGWWMAYCAATAVDTHAAQYVRLEGRALARRRRRGHGDHVQY